MDGGKGFYAIPLRASSKQWVGSQCDVKITTVWPRDLRPRAASMTRRSAPPMPRSGWMKMIVFFFGGADFLSKRGIIVLGEGEGVFRYDRYRVYLREGGGRAFLR